MGGSFRIGDWLVEPLHNRLVRGDTRVKLDPKVMQVLLYLAERRSEIAEKEKIIESVWEGTFVTDEVLTNAIWELRKAFGDDAKEPQFIQTVPRKGYRLLGPVEEAAGARRGQRRTWVAIVSIVVDAEGWFTRRITATDSRNYLASWSHDGRWIYFTSERTGEAQIWKMPAEGGEATQITRHGGREPRESSDARALYFKADQPGNSLRQVPVDGGDELPIHGAREISSRATSSPARSAR